MHYVTNSTDLNELLVLFCSAKYGCPWAQQFSFAHSISLSEKKLRKKPSNFLKIHWGGVDGELMSRFLYAFSYLTEVLSDLKFVVCLF